MKFRTEIDIPKAGFEIKPQDRLLFVGSCFADNLGRRFVENQFRATVNPYGVMYNPASILHTVERERGKRRDIAIFTLGTNHVYILNETGEIVDNCQKRPQRLFTEKELTIDECADYLSQAVDLLQKEISTPNSQRPTPNSYLLARPAGTLARARTPNSTKIILTVSPIRYAKYGYHGSQLSKATLLLAAHELCRRYPDVVSYFPAYEIVNDELRDYRFYKEDMLHPSDQAVEYIYERFAQAYFGPETRQFLAEWKPIKEALAHKPFHPESPEYQRFLAETREKEREFKERWRLTAEL